MLCRRRVPIGTAIRGALLALLACGLVALAGWWAWRAEAPPQADARFTSPTGQHQLLVLRHPGWRARLPGQGGDSPGEVPLQDAQGRVLPRTGVPMVNLVDTAHGQPGSVRIPLVADWPLPP